MRVRAQVCQARVRCCFPKRARSSAEAGAHRPGPRLLGTSQGFRVLVSVQRDRSRPACGRCQEQRARELLFRGREEKTGRDWTQSVARPQAGSSTALESCCGKRFLHPLIADLSLCGCHVSPGSTRSGVSLRSPRSTGPPTPCLQLWAPMARPPLQLPGPTPLGLSQGTRLPGALPGTRRNRPSGRKYT